MQVDPITSKVNVIKGSTGVPLKVRLFDGATGEAYDLTGHTVKFYMAPVSDIEDPKINGKAAVVTSAAEGRCEYRWVTEDVDTVGDYVYEFEFTITSSSKTFRIPAGSRGQIKIIENIGT